MQRNYGVIGKPISHSLSPSIHQSFAKQFGISLTYQIIETEEFCFQTEVSNFFDAQGSGLNITLPFKELAYQFASVSTFRCQQAKAANTLWVQDGLVYADNTDGVGLIRDLARWTELDKKEVLLLGAGGAARGIITPLLAEPIKSLTVFNRTVARLSDLKQDFPEIKECLSLETSGHYDLIINATSAGLLSKDFSMLSGILTKSTYCYDLVYNLKGVTPFTQWAKQHGCVANDGLGMLVEQAAESFFIWHGVMPNTSSVLTELRAWH